MKLSTTCSFPPELTERQLLEALDGIADEAVAAHLKNCPYCQTRANSFENTQNRLKSRLFRATCPPSLELAEFYLRTLPAPHMLTVSAHVRGCPHCAREIAELGAFMGADAVAQEATLLEQAQVFVARLIDSSPAFGGLRGESRSVTLEVEGAVITFEMQSAPNGKVAVLGQVAADEQDVWTGAIVTLQQADAARQTASVNDLGAFTFEAVPPGGTEFIITSLHNQVIKIPPLDIHT
jgi:anti-sigma factor RsiW